MTPIVQELFYSWAYVLKHSGKNANKSAPCLEQFKYSNGNSLAAGAQSHLLSSGVWISAKHLGSEPQLKLMVSEQRMIYFC